MHPTDASQGPKDFPISRESWDIVTKILAAEAADRSKNETTRVRNAVTELAQNDESQIAEVIRGLTDFANELMDRLEKEPVYAPEVPIPRIGDALKKCDQNY